MVAFRYVGFLPAKRLDSSYLPSSGVRICRMRFSLRVLQTWLGRSPKRTSCTCVGDDGLSLAHAVSAGIGNKRLQASNCSCERVPRMNVCCTLFRMSRVRATTSRMRRSQARHGQAGHHVHVLALLAGSAYNEADGQTSTCFVCRIRCRSFPVFRESVFGKSTKTDDVVSSERHRGAARTRSTCCESTRCKVVCRVPPFRNPSRHTLAGRLANRPHDEGIHVGAVVLHRSGTEAMVNLGTQAAPCSEAYADAFRTALAEVWPASCRKRSMPVEVGPNLAKSGTKPDIGRFWLGICQSWSDFGRVCPETGQTRPTLARNRPGVIKIWAEFVRC